PWIITTFALALVALALYFVLERLMPDGITGGSVPGLAFAVAGSSLMIFAGLLSALRKVPAASWLGARKTWLRGHIWLGLLSAVLIACHSGFRWGGWLERALWIVLLATLLTGIIGLALQHIIPRMITTRVSREAPYEQIPHIYQGLRTRADEIM